MKLASMCANMTLPPEKARLRICSRTSLTDTKVRWWRCHRNGGLSLGRFPRSYSAGNSWSHRQRPLVASTMRQPLAAAWLAMPAKIATAVEASAEAPIEANGCRAWPHRTMAAKAPTWVKLAGGLGHDFTAEALHAFFSSCELITTKKPSQSGAGSYLRYVSKKEATGVVGFPQRPALGGQWQRHR